MLEFSWESNPNVKLFGQLEHLWVDAPEMVIQYAVEKTDGEHWEFQQAVTARVEETFAQGDLDYDLKQLWEEFILTRQINKDETPVDRNGKAVNGDDKSKGHECNKPKSPGYHHTLNGWKCREQNHKLCYLIQEENAGYCRDKEKFGGVKCSACQAHFMEKGKSKRGLSFVPRGGQPIYHCQHFGDCGWAICHLCARELLLNEETQGGERSSRRRAKK